VSLTVVTGAPNTGKTGRVYGVLRAAVRDGHRAVLLLPAGPDVARARAELARDEPIGVRVEQFDRFFAAQWALSGDGRRMVVGAARDVLLARALVAAHVADEPGPGAVALLGALAAQASAHGSVVESGVRGVAGRLLKALEAYRDGLFKAALVEPGEAARFLIGGRPSADTIVVHRFMDLSATQEILLTAWGSGATKVVISLPWEAGLAAASALTPLVERLQAAGASLDEVRTGGADDPPELARIATGLFAGPDPCPSEGRVRLGVAQGAEAEARLVAGYVRAWHEEGFAFDRIAVAFRDPAQHVGWLRRVFREAAIPADFDVPIAVGETPLGRALRHLWAFASGGMSRGDLAAFMRTPFSGVDPAVADAADSEWRRTRLLHGRALLRGAGQAGKLAQQACTLAHEGITHETARQWQGVADRLLANAHPGDAPLAGADAALDAAVHRGFSQALGDVLTLGQGSVSAGEMWRGFESRSVTPVAAERLGRVQVISVERLRARRFDCVAIGGLTSGEFPRLGTEDRLQGEAVRRALVGLGLSAEARDEAAWERMSFYLGVTRARRNLALVRRDCDDEGRALRPSVFWDEFLDLYRDPEGGETAAGMPAVDVRTFSDLECDRVGRRRQPRGRLDTDAALDILARRAVFSAGEIEAYTGCPYRWFVERVVRPQTLEASVDAAAVGSAEHQALARFYRAWREQTGCGRVTADGLAEALDMAGACVDEALESVPMPVSIGEQRLVAGVKRHVLGLVERDADFLPGFEVTATEWSFGLDADDDPVDIGGVAVKGRADRIDVGPQGLVVIDYKRTEASPLARIRAKGLLQLQLYAIAASRCLGLPVAGGLYRSLSRGDDRGFGLAELGQDISRNDRIGREELDELLETAARQTKAAADGIRAGRIDPAPEAVRCRTCPASPFCAEAAR
jgi:hypothetical protein